MAIANVKKANMIVKANNELVHLLPTTKSEYVSYGESDVKSALDGLEDSSVVSAKAEVESFQPMVPKSLSFSVTGTDSNEHLTPYDYGFSLYLILYPVDSDAEGSANEAFESVHDNSQNFVPNTDYTYNMLLPDSVAQSMATETHGVMVGMAIVLKVRDTGSADGTATYGTTPAWKNSNSPYQGIGWIGDTSDEYDNSVNIDVPSVGDTATYYLNVKKTGSTYTEYSLPNHPVAGHDDLDIHVTLSRTDEDSCTCTLRWNVDASELEEPSGNPYKRIKTTLTKGDDSTVVQTANLSGLVTGVECSSAENYGTATVNSQSVTQMWQQLNVSSADADGTSSTQNVKLLPSSVASNVSNPSATGVSNGYVCNLDTTNLAKGGVCYEIESVVLDANG